MINELILFMKQNIHKNVTEFFFIIDKIVRIDIFINKLISTHTASPNFFRGGIGPK